MTSFCSILDSAASAAPDQPLFVFPETRWTAADSLTYADLALRAASAAECISDRAIAGDRALILFNTGAPFWEALFGCLATGIIAVPQRVPGLHRWMDALQPICVDCQPALILADDKTASQLQSQADQHAFLKNVRFLTPDVWRLGTSRNQLRWRTDVEIALLQYTSGSTSKPKGVQISHGNLLANSELIRQQMQIRIGDDRSVTWLPHYHDMGLVGSYLQTLFTRNTIWCLPPEEFAVRPERWLSLISEHRATICGGPDFGFRVCADRISDDRLGGIDLTSWRVAFNGAERVRPDTIRRFVERFARLGFSDRAFFPCYGLGECTLLATGGPAESGASVRRISNTGLMNNQIVLPTSNSDVHELAASGQLSPQCPIAIANPTTGEVVGDDVIGQILVSGASVSSGYYNRPDLNQELLVDLKHGGQTSRFLRTGDLGFTSRGELFITGRLSEIMIIRGRNLHPEDVEDQAWKSQPSLVPGGVVAFSVDLDGQESLVIAAEIQRAAARQKQFEGLVLAVRGRIVESFGVSPREIVLLSPGSIPRTTSGKLRRFSVRSDYLAGTMACLFRELNC